MVGHFCQSCMELYKVNQDYRFMVLMSADEQLFFVRSHIFQKSEGKVNQEGVKR